MPTTPSQTIGPFPHEAWAWAVEAGAPAGEPALWIDGRLLDGRGQAITDGWIEAWIPAAATAGSLPGLQRVATDEAGRFRIALAVPPAPGEPAALVTVFARGLLQHLHTAVFLADSPQLARVPAGRRSSLIARAGSPGRYGWDIRLQGEPDEETVFFDPA